MRNLTVLFFWGCRSSDGSFLQEILRADRLFGGTGLDENIEDNAVDLVFGGQLTDDIRVCRNESYLPCLFLKISLVWCHLFPKIMQQKREIWRFKGDIRALHKKTIH